jgi:hypothetical protein
MCHSHVAHQCGTQARTLGLYDAESLAFSSDINKLAGVLQCSEWRIVQDKSANTYVIEIAV